MWMLIVAGVALISTKVDIVNVASTLLGSIRDIIEFDGSDLGSLVGEVVDI